MKTNIICSFAILLLLLPINMVAQDKFTLERSGINLEELLEIIESKSEFEFYYKTEWISNLKTKVSYRNANLETILDDIFESTNLSYIRRGHLIVITKDLSAIEFISDTKDTQAVNNPEDEQSQQIIQIQEEEYKIHYIGTSTGNQKVKLFGYITHFNNQLPLNSVEIYLPNLSKGVTSDKKGYYEIELEPGNYAVKYRFMGLKEANRKIVLKGTGRLDVQLIDESKQIDEIKITAKDNKVDRTFMGTEFIDMKEVQTIPMALGEPDIIKSTTMLPGVESAGEGAVGFNVRGGSIDQNLILIDNAPIYYPAHFFGFFSPFNSDIISDANLYKASIPVEFGGRLSSTYDIHSHDNSVNEFHAKLGVSPVTSKVYFEAPIIKNKLSILNSYRFTYSDWVIDKINSKELINSSANFYDLQGKVIFKPNHKNQIDLAYYKSNDEFQLHSDTIYNYDNFIASINFRHRFSERLKVLNTLYSTNYSNKMSSKGVPESAFLLTHKLKETGGKTSWNFEQNINTNYNFGTDLKFYSVLPNRMRSNSNLSLIKNKSIDREKAVEASLFFGARFDITSKLICESGLRYSAYGNYGNAKELKFQNNIVGTDNIIDTITLNNNLRNIEHGPEIRFNINYKININSSIKASYNRNRQYIHLLSNTTSVSPNDNWKLSDTYMKPQVGDQWSLGYYYMLDNSNSEFSIEAYYKRSKNVKDYKDGAELYLNDFAETEVLNASGKNYGIELFLKKYIGRLKAMFSYSYSRSFLKSDEKTGEFSVNNGKYYRAPHDKPHNFKSHISWNLSRRFIISTNLSYHTGRPATYPISKYSIQDIPIIEYSDRNVHRLPNYFRMDFAILMQGNLKKKKAFHSSLTFGLYNLTGRKNAYSVYFQTNSKQVVGYKLSIFGQAVPTITYNIEF